MSGIEEMAYIDGEILQECDSLPALCPFALDFQVRAMCSNSPFQIRCPNNFIFVVFNHCKELPVNLLQHLHIFDSVNV